MATVASPTPARNLPRNPPPPPKKSMSRWTSCPIWAQALSLSRPRMAISLTLALPIS